MLYKINYTNFLVFMIDYFTREELLHCQYVLISAKIGHNNKQENVARISMLYPNSDIVSDYAIDNDKEKAKRLYREYLFPSEKTKSGEYKNDPYWCYNLINTTFIVPIRKHHDVIIIYDEEEASIFIDELCDLLKEKFKLEVLDLNRLFIKGKVDSIYLDIEATEKLIKPVMKKLAKKDMKCDESTKEGREKLLSIMSVQEKIKKLKKLGININKHDINNDKLNSLLQEAWVEDD